MQTERKRRIERSGGDRKVFVTMPGKMLVICCIYMSTHNLNIHRHHHQQLTRAIQYVPYEFVIIIATAIILYGNINAKLHRKIIQLNNNEKRRKKRTSESPHQILSCTVDRHVTDLQKK